jgi:hypothetical protein
MNIDLVLTDSDVERIAAAVLAKLKAEGGTVTKTTKATAPKETKGTEVKDDTADQGAAGPTREDVLAKLRALKDAKGEGKLNEVLHKYAPKWKEVKDEDLAKLLVDVDAAIAAPADDDI